MVEDSNLDKQKMNIRNLKWKNDSDGPWSRSLTCKFVVFIIIWTPVKEGGKFQNEELRISL